MEMLNWNFITQRIAIGEMIANREVANYLKNHKITHILNVNTVDDMPVIEGIGFEYLWNAERDDGKAKPVAWFEKSLNFALPALVRPKVRLYVHCRMGLQRAPSTAYCIMRALGFMPDLCVKLIKTPRPKCGISYKKDADIAIRALGFEEKNERYLQWQ